MDDAKSSKKPTAPERSLQRHVVNGTTWGIAICWAARLTGVVSTVLLARLLTPADFGIVAIAMLIVSAVHVFSQTGQRMAILRHPNPTREHYDTAWTIQILVGLGLGLVILAATPLTTAYFHEPRAAPVVEIFALGTVLANFENIGTVDFRRHFQFSTQFQLSMVTTLISFVVTVIFAFALRTYWALVIGTITEQISFTTLSYVFSSYRPRFSLAKTKEIWTFSIWMLFRYIATYLNSQVDKFAIGGFGGASVMGRFEVAEDIATSPSKELNDPMITTLWPVMIKVQHDKVQRRTLYLRVLYWSSLICISTSIGVALVSDDMVDLVLGARWQDVKPLMPWLALAFGLLSLSSSVYSAFDTIGRPDLSARLQWTRLLGLTLCIIPVAYFMRDSRAVVITRFLVTVAITPTLFVALGRALELSARDLIFTLWRPATAGLVMAGVVLGVNAAITFAGSLRLLLDVGLGIVSFISSLFALWFVTGKPDGPETLLWTALRTHKLHLGLVAAIDPE